MTRSYVWHDLSTHVTWLIRRELRKILGFLKVYQSVCAMCLIQTFDRIFSYVWLNACTCVTWLVHTCDMTHSQGIAQMSGSSRSVSQSVCGVPYPYVWHVSFVCVTRLMHMYDMTHSHACHDSFTGNCAKSWGFPRCIAKCMWYALFVRVTCLIHMCAMTHAHVRHDSFTRLTWLIHTCDMTHSYMWHDSFTRVTWLIHRELRKILGFLEVYRKVSRLRSPIMLCGDFNGGPSGALYMSICMFDVRRGRETERTEEGLYIQT